MNALRALARLRDLKKAVLTTADAANALGLTASAVSHTLARLAAAGLAVPIRRGTWTLDPQLDPLLLPEHLTAPLPSYVSLHSALYLHGMISQIPSVVYVASLTRTRRVHTSLGTFSIHRLAPGFFGGFASHDSGVRLATPEKALLDTLYLAPARSRSFARLPEVALPGGFRVREARRWLARIPSGPRRAMVTQRFERLWREHTTAAGRDASE